MTQLDRIDIEIIRQLRNNARLSNKELAAIVGLAPSSCLVRVRGLQREGVLRGYHAEVDTKSLGVGLQAMISIRLARHSKADVESFRSHVLALVEVRELYHLAGANDFLVQVWVRDPEHLRQLIMSAFTAREEVAHIETGLIFEHTQSLELPVYIDCAIEDEL
ncbi:MAG: Lrp/AsnC family transcriptional regulator [Proteobacteria bacterium]|nr:Lrp/AsnC family transcriptional regulator [Pseudomonadota bacterium]